MSRTSEARCLHARPVGAGPMPDAAPVSVGIVDDDAIARAWLAACLEGSEFWVAGEAATAEEAVALVERRRPQLLLVDFGLPDLSGTELVRALREHGEPVPVLVITAWPKAGLNELAEEAGAQGVMLKRNDAGMLLETLRRVVSGVDVWDADVPRRDRGVSSLSPRELEVLRHVAEGSTNAEIGASLGLSVESVKTLLQRAFLKLGARNRVEAVELARRRGFV